MAGTKLQRQQREERHHQQRLPMDDHDNDEDGDSMITEEELEDNPRINGAYDGDDEHYSTDSNSLMEEYDNYEDEEEYVGLIPTSGRSGSRRGGKRSHRGVKQKTATSTSTFWNQHRWWLIVVIFVVFAFVAEFHLSSRNGHQHHDQDVSKGHDHTSSFSDPDDQQQVLDNHDQDGSNNDDDRGGGDNVSIDELDPAEEESSNEEKEEDHVNPTDEPAVPLQVPPSPYEMATYGDGKQYNMYYRDYTYRRRGKEAFKSLEDITTISENDKTSWPMHMSCHPTSLQQHRREDQYDLEDWYRTNFTHRDVPRDEFPIDSWQRNMTYVREEFLPSSMNLVQQAMKFIYAEYGHEYSTSSNTSATMFNLTILDKHYDFSDDPKGINKKNAEVLNNGGWLTNQAYVGLKRRLLHAIITQDSFIVAMGGHSAAAGHGNHFQQSYTLQVQRILQPIFARLGVYHEARNFGQGGLGTLQNSLALQSLYGSDLDMLLWDSGMTEGKNKRNIEIMARQALLGRQKIPVLLNFPVNILKPLFQATMKGVDDDNGENYDIVSELEFAILGSGMSGIPKADISEELDSIPYAARYMRCHNDIKKDFCDPQTYSGICWITRDDYEPVKHQDKAPGGRASWHPGHRQHQLTGRVWTMMILQALSEVLTDWKQYVDEIAHEDATSRIPLPPDETWHMTEYYSSIRRSTETIEDDVGSCMSDTDIIPWDIICHYPLKGRSEFTPRAFPEQTSIRSLMSQRALTQLNPVELSVYDPPDVYIPIFDPPDDAVDVLSKVERGPPFCPLVAPSYLHWYYDDNLNHNLGNGRKLNRNIDQSTFVPGQGIRLDAQVGFCDGTLDSFCSRSTHQPCLLRSHNDHRGGLYFDSYSGWIIMDVPQVELGMVIIKMETWHPPNEVEKTKGWKSINNEMTEEDGGSRRMYDDEGAFLEVKEQDDFDPNKEDERILGAKAVEYCDEFRFEYSIDGVVTSLNSTEFRARNQGIGQNNEVITLSHGETPKKKKKLQQRHRADDEEEDDNDDEKSTESTSGKTVQVAIRMIGCGQSKVYKLTHIYWA